MTRNHLLPFSYNFYENITQFAKILWALFDKAKTTNDEWRMSKVNARQFSKFGFVKKRPQDPHLQLTCFAMQKNFLNSGWPFTDDWMDSWRRKKVDTQTEARTRRSWLVSLQVGESWNKKKVENYQQFFGPDFRLLGFF